MFKNERYYIPMTNLHFEVHKPVFVLFKKIYLKLLLGFITYRVHRTRKTHEFELLRCRDTKTNFNINPLFSFGDEMCRQDREDRLLLPNIFTLKVNVRCTYHVQRWHK